MFIDLAAKPMSGAPAERDVSVVNMPDPLRFAPPERG
jgi:hypothetical protein